MKLVSAEGAEFWVDRKCAMVSGTIKAMLSGECNKAWSMRTLAPQPLLSSSQIVNIRFHDCIRWMSLGFPGGFPLLTTGGIPCVEVSPMRVCPRVSAPDLT